MSLCSNNFSQQGFKQPVALNWLLFLCDSSQIFADLCAIIQDLLGPLLEPAVLYVFPQSFERVSATEFFPPPPPPSVLPSGHIFVQMKYSLRLVSTQHLTYTRRRMDAMEGSMFRAILICLTCLYIDIGFSQLFWHIWKLRWKVVETRRDEWTIIIHNEWKNCDREAFEVNARY